MHILIAGGTGTSGRVLAERAHDAGHQVRVLTRGPVRPDAYGQVQADVRTGEGLAAAMAGIDAVVDLTNISTARYGTASAFFTAATERLFDAEQRAGVRHHLTLSIVGIDRFPSGYYRAKLTQEAAVVACSARTGVGHTIARVTQFHDFAALALERFRVGPVVLAPPLQVQPVHLDDVADHLLQLLLAGPTGMAPELGGPQPEDLTEMIRRLAVVTGHRVRVLPAPLLGTLGRANKAGVLRPNGGLRGTLTFAQWLGEVPTWTHRPSRV